MAQLMNHSVYWIHLPEHTNIFTQGYIGVSKDVCKRWNEHHKKTNNMHLKNAINKYGWDNLIKDNVLIGSKDYCLTIETKLRNTENVGWNIVSGGGCPPLAYGNQYRIGVPSWNKGIPCSIESKVKIKNQVIKLWENPTYRQHMSDAHKGQLSPMKGKKHSVKSLLQMSLVKLGKPSGKKGFKNSVAVIQKMKELAVKESWECPHCNTQGNGKGAGIRWHFNNCKQKEVA